MDFNYHYRRRHLDNTTGISITTGPAIGRRDDHEAAVFDYVLAGPSFHSPVTGRRGCAIRTIARPPATAVRLWLWPARPLRILQQFSAAGLTTLYRIDFATPPQRHGDAIFQTDLYLDIFVAADTHDYVIQDEDELSLARSRELITPEQHERILAQCDELVQLLEGGGFADWLAATCAAPFNLAELRGERGWLYRGSAPGEADGWPEGIH